MPGGRKPLGDPKDGRASLLNFKVSKEQFQLLDRLVQQTGSTRSDVMRAALQRYLQLEEVPEAS